MPDDRTTYYELFNEYEQAPEAPPSPAYLKMEARLASLSKESEAIIREFNSILGPPAKDGQITLLLCERAASVITRIDKRVVLAVGAYCELREAEFRMIRKQSMARRMEQPLTDRVEVLKKAMFMTWCRIRDLDPGSPPTNDFYEFFFSYKDAVLEVASTIEGCTFWLNLQAQNDRKWWGGAKPDYAKAAKLMGDAFMLATVDYAVE